jgi:hypothetical protein
MRAAVRRYLLLTEASADRRWTHMRRDVVAVAQLLDGHGIHTKPILFLLFPAARASSPRDVRAVHEPADRGEE